MDEQLTLLQSALAGRYAIERELGHGGMATVYLALDVKHDRKVALKVLRPELSILLGAGAERFLREIRISARLDHPHILTLIDSGSADGFLWYVVPFVRGESLRQKLEREVQLTVDEALSITTQVAGALDYAHRQGVIHRDVKPENILLHEGEAMLADFGIALAVEEAGRGRLSHTGISPGTPQYMSPEQAAGREVLDGRSDVYSLAVVLYEMLTGTPPHTGATAQAIMAKVLTERPTPIRTVRETVPASVDEAVTKALAKVPRDRFAQAGEFAKALSTGIKAEPKRRPRAKSWMGIPRSQLMIAAMVVVTVLVAMLVKGREGATNPVLDPQSPEMQAEAPEIYNARFETSAGTFTVQVTREWATEASDRFYNLVRHGFFDGTRFFRVVPGVIVQFGLSGTPAVSARWQLAPMIDDPVLLHNLRGTITFVTAGPNSRTTQVFINLADNVKLDGLGYAPFGRVVEGLDVVDRIYSGYGSLPDQAAIREQGNAYLTSHFPRLDSIAKATIATPTDTIPLRRTDIRGELSHNPQGI